MDYIALLRGVNVGGKNKLPMKELKAAFEAHGFFRVSTYIQSGNVLFSAENQDVQLLRRACEELIAERFALRITVAVLPAAAVADAMDQAPPWWNAELESKHNAIFVIPPATPETVLKAVGGTKPEYEQVSSCGGVIFWSAPIKTFSRTRLSRVVGSSLYDFITIRNANTALELARLARANAAGGKDVLEGSR